MGSYHSNYLHIAYRKKEKGGREGAVQIYQPPWLQKILLSQQKLCSKYVLL